MEKQTMVIEYNGTILRKEVAVMKEKIYRSQVKHLGVGMSFVRETFVY